MFDHVFDIEVDRRVPRHQRAIGRDNIEKAESARIARENAEKAAASQPTQQQTARGRRENSKD